MPGLLGVVSINGDKVNLDLIGAMRNSIQHEDWYKVDDYVNPGGTVAISRVHLGILNPDKQPYGARNGRVKVFLHGEIYNDEISVINPLEFIFWLYEKEGLNFASSLNGSFLIVIVDEDEGVTLIANDRIASKPLFYFNDGRAIYFGPEMKSLLLTPSLERKLDLAAIADFLINGHFIREHTLIEGLTTVDKATVLKVTEGGVTRHKYWEFDLETEDKDQGWVYYQEKLAELLRRAVSRCLRTDNTYGILMSGGYDSRGILGCYLEQRNDRELHTISWGQNEDMPHSDCAIAKKLAQKLGADHRFYELSAEKVINNFRNFVLLGEGLTWYPESYEVFHQIRKQQGVDIVLRGDECFGLSKWLEVHDENTMLRALSINALHNSRQYQKILKPFYYQLFCERDVETTRYALARCRAENIHDHKDFLYLDVRLKYYLNPLNYVKNFALESFTPLLDNDLLDFVRVLPLKYRLGKKLWRETVVKIFPELFEEIAQQRNDITWGASFRRSPELQRFIYRELVEEPSILSEFINIDALRNELDSFFAPPPHPLSRQALKAKVKTSALNTLKRLPIAYSVAHKFSYQTQKSKGKIASLPDERVIIHLLILKMWGDIFLNYPVVKVSG